SAARWVCHQNDSRRPFHGFPQGCSENTDLLQWVRILPLVGKSESKSSASRGRSRNAQRRGIRAASFLERSLHDASAHQYRRQGVIRLMTSRLIIDAVRRVALLLQLLPNGPRSGPRRRIVDGDGVLERVRVEARPPFDEVEVFVRALKV